MPRAAKVGKRGSLDAYGTFTILGGAGDDSQDVLASIDFTVGVGQEPSAVPEPGTLLLLACGLVAGAVATGIKRR